MAFLFGIFKILFYLYSIKIKQIMELNLTAFVESYLATAAWVTCDSGENENFTPEAKAIAEQDCIKFINAVREEFGDEKAKRLLSVGGTDVANRTSHDFFLTRNHHGAGFWDNPEKYEGQETADKLTEIAQTQGEVFVYHVSGRKRNRLTF